MLLPTFVMKVKIRHEKHKNITDHRIMKLKAINNIMLFYNVPETNQLNP